MNKCVETFLTAIAAIIIYNSLIKACEYIKYKPDEVDTASNDFALETDQFDLNRIKAEVSE